MGVLTFPVVHDASLMILRVWERSLEKGAIGGRAEPLAGRSSVPIQD
jgi:hypothetical protein